jgi:hypothetical protein
MAEKARNGVHKPFQGNRLTKHGTGFLKERTMTPEHEQRITEMLVAAMTSGLPHQGAKYMLPESLAIEFGRLCYNQAVKDIQQVVQNLSHVDTRVELLEVLMEYQLKQRKEKA